MGFDEYYVRMAATPDTYEYDIVYRAPDGPYLFKTYTLAQVHAAFPDIRNNIDALIALQERGAELLEKTVDTAREG